MPSYIRTQVDVVLPEGTAVLNAAEPEVAALAKYCDGQVIFYADDEHNERLQVHRSEGHRVVFWRDGQLLLTQGLKTQSVLSSQRPAVARL
jgi:cyanophycin synthetase